MRSHRILLVEDNADHAALVERSIDDGSEIATITVVPDGEEALGYLQRDGQWKDPASSPRPDLVLLDLRLPRLDGFHVLKAIKESRELRSIPVVILTTSDADPDVAKACALHANSYLVKPVDFDRFVALMRDAARYWLSCNRGATIGSSI